MNKVKKETILLQIDRIITDVKKERIESFSLYGGLAGSLLLKTYYNLYIENNKIEITQELEHLIDNCLENSYTSISNGKAGINWFFSYLNRKELIDKEDRENLCSDDVFLKTSSLYYLAQNNWDFLHGGLGIAYYALYNPMNFDVEYFNNVFNELFRICDLNPKYKMFIDDQIDNKERVNLGLAHGLPSVLKFCVQSYKQEVCKNQAKKLAYKIIDFLLNNSFKNELDYCYYPPTISEGKKIPSRLAWCYGDLGIGFILYQAGLVFNDIKIKNFAMEILISCTKRRKFQDTIIFDAGICHGSAGVAHIFNKMAHYTDNVIFKEAADFWIIKTLEFATHKNGIGGYKSYTHKDEKWEKNVSFLEGSIGIGLVLSSYLTGEFSWDYCLMLND